MTDDINALRARISELEALIFSSGKPISQFGTISLPRSVVEQALYHLNRGDADAVCWADGVIKPALEQPQRKLTPQDIADSTLLGNIESPFNACMHQEHCKRWKAQAEQHVADHQRESSIDNELPSENGQLITTSSSVPFGYKLAPVEPTVEMMDAGGAATRRCYQHLNKDEVMCSYVYRAMLAAAPQPPAVEQPQNEQEPVGFVRQIDIDHIAKTPSDWGAMFGSSMGFNTVPLYTHPQPKRELTDEQIAEVLIDETNGRSTGIGFKTLRAFARAIERAHGIGQGAAPQPLKDEHAPGEVR